MMLSIADEAIAERMRSDNPWWRGPLPSDVPPLSWPRRAYYFALRELLRQPVQRAIIVLGARRVGKTTLLRQLIAERAAAGDAGPIFFASVDTPTLTGLSLEQLLELFARVHPHDANGPRLVVFDEIQYLPDWERHLKDLVDRFPRTRFIASGSAGAALKRKSTESGAGRFTDFELPPLTFAEFLDFRDETGELLDVSVDDPTALPAVKSFARLNAAFVDYVNVGGYPEVVRSPTVQADLERFVRNDIVQKVLLQDLPSLYGITNIPELNKLFTTVAYNTAQLVSLEALSQNSGISKPTIAKYLEYLEAAFLIVRLKRVDDAARRLQRERNFKVYLTNPSMRAALFSPIDADDEAMGFLAETALVTQYLHAPVFRELAFANWGKGEVDLVHVDAARQSPRWALDVKWSDRAYTTSEAWAPLLEFAANNQLPIVHMTSRTALVHQRRNGVTCVVLPIALLCYQAGRLAASKAAVLTRHGLPVS